jgi:hypothetical protein
MGILIFKGLTSRRLYKSFGVKALNQCSETNVMHFFFQFIKN